MEINVARLLAYSITDCQQPTDLIHVACSIYLVVLMLEMLVLKVVADDTLK